MARPKTPQQSFFPIHVTARCNNKDWFSIALNKCWEIFVNELSEIVEKYQIDLHAFVLMSNHFHLMLSTPQGNLGNTMKYFMSKTSRQIAREAGRINHVFGARYKWSLLHEQQSVAYVLKYIYRNPVRAGITQTVEDYPYSTISCDKFPTIPMPPLMEKLDWKFLPVTNADRLAWLNAPTFREEALIRLALRRTTFNFSRDKKVQLKLAGLKRVYLSTVEV